MHVISKKKPRECWQHHDDAENALATWYRVATKANWSNLAEVGEAYATADQANELTVFNNRGNSYRLITRTNYRSRTIFIRAVLTHAEYDRGSWKRE